MTGPGTGSVTGSVTGSASGYGPENFAAAFGVSRETCARFVRYETALRRWQRRVNLVGASTLDDIWRRHFADSAQLAAHLHKGARRIVDLGSGAGFPGLVLKLLRPELDVTLIEADARKAAFLSATAAELSADVAVLAARIEDVARDPARPEADVVTARALAPLPDLLDLASGWSVDNPQFLLLKGQNIEKELISSTKCWKMAITQFDSVTHPGGRVLSIERIARVKI